MGSAEMRYRVKFLLHGRMYYTEWFDTFGESLMFTHDANAAGKDVFPIAIEDEDGNVA
jgi:hypothetical protein